MKTLSQFTAHLEKNKEYYQQQAQQLAQDNRPDESIMAKIRGNMFDIIMQIKDAAEKLHPESPISFISEFIDKITARWEASIAASEAHNDHSKAAIERIKLNTMAEIKELLPSIEEDTNVGH